MRKRIHQARPTRPARGRFSDELRDCIDRDGRSPYSIAKAAEIDPAQLSRFMRGLRGLTTETLDGLAAALGLHLVAATPGRGRPRRVAPAEGRAGDGEALADALEAPDGENPEYSGENPITDGDFRRN